MVYLMVYHILYIGILHGIPISILIGISNARKMCGVYVVYLCVKLDRQKFRETLLKDRGVSLDFLFVLV